MIRESWWLHGSGGGGVLPSQKERGKGWSGGIKIVQSG